MSVDKPRQLILIGERTTFVRKLVVALKVEGVVCPHVDSPENLDTLTDDGMLLLCDQEQRTGELASKILARYPKLLLGSFAGHGAINGTTCLSLDPKRGVWRTVGVLAGILYENQRLSRRVSCRLRTTIVAPHGSFRAKIHDLSSSGALAMASKARAGALASGVEVSFKIDRGLGRVSFEGQAIVRRIFPRRILLWESIGIGLEYLPFDDEQVARYEALIEECLFKADVARQATATWRR